MEEGRKKEKAGKVPLKAQEEFDFEWFTPDTRVHPWSQPIWVYRSQQEDKDPFDIAKLRFGPLPFNGSEITNWGIRSESSVEVFGPFDREHMDKHHRTKHKNECYYEWYDQDYAYWTCEVSSHMDAKRPHLQHLFMDRWHGSVDWGNTSSLGPYRTRRWQRHWKRFYHEAWSGCQKKTS